MPQVTLFISTVSREFASYRDALRHALTRPDVAVKIQEDFQPNGDVTIDKLATYVQSCDAVIHLVGDQPGYPLNAPSLAWLRQQYPQLATDFPDLAEVVDGTVSASYTQWEAYLALLHNKKLVIAQPTAQAYRDHDQPGHQEPVQPQAQHLARLRQLGRYAEVVFANPDRLVAKLSVSVLLDLLLRATNPVRPANLPYRSLHDLFKGREADLLALRTRLTDPAAPAALALTGLGGVGKTRLAVEYAWQYRPDYSALLLVPADSPATLEANLAALARPGVLNLPEWVAPEASSPEQAARQQEVCLAAVLRWLAQHPGGLLILDNVDTREAAAAVEAWLPRLQAGRVLLTTRYDDFSPQVEPLSLGVLPEAAAAKFLLARTPRRAKAPSDEAEALALTQQLGSLALALEQAGAYVNTQRISLAEYHRLWQTNAENVRGEFDEQLMHYHSSVAATWQTSFDQLSSAARTLLGLLAWLAPDPVPRSLLGLLTNFNARRGLVELARYSLARFTDDGQSFTVHPLVQEVTRASLGDDLADALEGALLWVNLAFDGDLQDVRAWPALDPLVPHARLLAGQYGLTHTNLDPTRHLAGKLGTLLYAKGQFGPAEALFRQALALHEPPAGPGGEALATSLNDLACLLLDTGRLSEAEQLYRRALHLCQASPEPDAAGLAASLGNLANLLHETRQLPEAELLCRQALAINEAQHSPDHPAVAISLNNLASLLETADRPAEAEPLFRRALAINEAHCGPDHPRVAGVLNNLAALLGKVHHLPEAQIEAEAMHRRALRIREAAYGPHHPDVANSLTNLALLLAHTNRMAEAEPLYIRALASNEASYGPSHSQVASSLLNLASVWQQTQRLAEAIELLRRALRIEQATYGPDHHMVLFSLDKLATALRDAGQLTEAAQLYQQALASSDASPDPASLLAADLRCNLAHLVKLLNQFAEAEELLLQAVQIRLDKLGPDHPLVGVTFFALGLLLAEADCPDYAIDAFQQALAINVACYGPEHEEVSVVLTQLWAALRETGQEEQAAEIFEWARAIRQLRLL